MWGEVKPSPHTFYLMTNFFVAGVWSGPIEPTARTANVYLPGARCRYVFPERHGVNDAIVWARRSAHSNVGTAGIAANLNDAESLAWLTVAFAIFVSGIPT